MKSFSEIARSAERTGFSVVHINKHYDVTFDREDKLQFKCTLSDDEVFDSIKDGEFVSWEYWILNAESGEEIFRDYLEYYGKSPDELLDALKMDVEAIFKAIIEEEIKVVEKYLFQIFGVKFFKSKELLVRDDQGWTTIWDRSPG